MRVIAAERSAARTPHTPTKTASVTGEGKSVGTPGRLQGDSAPVNPVRRCQRDGNRRGPSSAKEETMPRLIALILAPLLACATSEPSTPTPIEEQVSETESGLTIDLKG